MDFIGWISQSVQFLHPPTGNLKGDGFRIRYKLPADSDKIVFEQFNLRALIHSNQDGYGTTGR